MQSHRPAVNISEQVQQFTTCAYDAGDIVEIRHLPSGRSSWCPAAELPNRVDGLRAENGAGEHVYVGLNPRSKFGGRSAADVRLARALFADFDDGATLESARHRWEGARLPEPTLIIASGHGVHAFWRLSEPILDLSVWSNFQRDLAALLGSDAAVHDAPRLCRLPGFVNHKRPVAPCTIIDADPGRLYELAELAEHIPDTTEAPMAAATPQDEGGVPTNNGKHVRLDVLGRASLYAAKWPGVGEGQRNSEAVRHAAALTHDFALSDDRAWPILSAWNATNQPPLDDDELRRCLANGQKYGKNPEGCRANAPPPGKSNRPGSSNRWASPARLIDPYNPFPAHVLPEAVRWFVTEAAAAIGCEACFIALPLLAALAAAIGNTRRIRLKRKWTEPAVLWSAIIADSGMLKSPALATVLESARKKQREAFAEYKKSFECYEREKLEYERELGQWKKAKRDGEPPEKPAKPIAVRYLCSDVTVEALATVLEENPRGILVARDELSGLIGSFDAYKKGRGNDVSLWLEMQRAGELVVDRKTGDRKVIYIPRAAVSITGTVQPRILGRALGEEHFENGLAARFLVGMPPRQARKWTDADVSPGAVFVMERVFGGLYALEFQTGAGDGDPNLPVCVQFTPEAKARWVEFYNQHGREQTTLGDSDLMAAWSKLEGYAARLALVHHLVRTVTTDDPPADPLWVDEQSTEAGITLARWFGREARRVYAALGESAADRECRQLVELVRNRGGQVTPRDLMRSGPCYHKSQDAESALNQLVEQELGRWMDPPPPAPHGGRPSRVFRLADTTDTDKTPSGAHVSGGSVSVSGVSERAEAGSEPAGRCGRG